MKLARYVGQGQIEIRDEPEPSLPPGGLLIKTEASGLCSGELVDWYMERKVPHVLGHEVSGTVIASDFRGFPVGSRVVPHHHAACGECDECRLGHFVHCAQWKRTKFIPGGMAEVFAVTAEGLTDIRFADGVKAKDAALMEPLGCVIKSIGLIPDPTDVAIVGLGTMGLMHMAMLRQLDPAPDALEPCGFEINPERRAWAEKLGFQTADIETKRRFDTVVVCPGTQSALDFAMRIAAPQSRIILFAPMPPGAPVSLDWDSLYFREISLMPSYSCGPLETKAAMAAIREGKVRAKDVVTHFIGIEELPGAYQAMKKGEILKAMVIFE